MKKAPEFRLQNSLGKWRTLSEIVEKSPAILVFYPGDFTPVCTKQLCSYQDSLVHLKKFGIQIVGISPDPIESHQKFAEEFGLGFELLSDVEKNVFKAYGVKSKLLFGMISRAIFVVDSGLSILYAKVEATGLTHRKSDDLLEILQKLKETKKI